MFSETTCDQNGRQWHSISECNHSYGFTLHSHKFWHKRVQCCFMRCSGYSGWTQTKLKYSSLCIALTSLQNLASDRQQKHASLSLIFLSIHLKHQMENKKKTRQNILKCTFKINAVTLITETCQFSYKRKSHNMLVQLRET